MLPNVQKKLNLFVVLMTVVVVFSLPVAATAQEVNDVNLEGLRKLEEPRQGPGTVEGTGTYFEVTDSNYLNITLESSEVVHLMLESVPEMVIMDIEVAEGATSTQTTLGGFLPSTTYYKYEDNYHNEVAFTTDANGSYSYVQDLAEPHLVFIQPNAGTRFIPSDTEIGTWDPATRIYTLTANVSESIQIDEDNLTLDGAGYTVTGPSSGPWSGFGVYLPNRTGVTIENVNVKQFGYGIYLYYSSGCTLTDNAVSNNYRGIYLTYSTNSTLTDNSVNSNVWYGIYLYYCSGSTLRSNTISGSVCNFGLYGWVDSDFDNDIDTTNTVDGKPIYYVRNAVGKVYDSSTNAGVFYAIDCDNITIKDLALTKNLHGVFLWRTPNSRIENVTASDNSYGIELRYSSNSALTGNNTLRNSSGIELRESGNSILTHNIANDEGTGIRLLDSGGSTLTGNTSNGRNYGYGIYLGRSGGSTLTGNTISNHRYGIALWSSGGSTLRNNTMSGNDGYNFSVLVLPWVATDADFDYDIDISNLVDGKPIYYVKNTTDVVYDSSTNAGVFYAINCDGITIKDLTLTKNYYGVCLWKTHNSTIENVTASNHEYGICLGHSTSNTLTGNTANSNKGCGIGLWDSSYNTLIGNTANSNFYYGFRIHDSSYSTLIGNTANSNNYYGIVVGNSPGSTLTDNTANSNINWYGIWLAGSDGSTLRGNTMTCNGYNFAVGCGGWGCSNNDIDTSNLVDGKPVYYVTNITGTAEDPVVYDSSTNAGTFYAINCDNITIKDLTLTKNFAGVFLWKTHNSRIENVTASNNVYGIRLYSSNNNTVTCNTATNNYYYGIELPWFSHNNILTCNTVSSSGLDAIRLRHSNGNTLTGNTASNNEYGIRLLNSSYNEIYNNNFIDNATQADVTGLDDPYYPSIDNVFNLDWPIGGNYWNNWTSPDVDPEDGFVDNPYVFTGGQDNLPLVSEFICVCNEAPVANAGKDESVHPGTVVTLDGSASSDPDEDYPLTYSWEITSKPEGSVSILFDADTVGPTFIPDLMGDYTIELLVTDSLGAQSAPDSVLVSTYNTPPVADAGPDQAIIELGTIVQLGTDPTRQSWDEDGDSITYLWTMTGEPAGSTAELSDPSSATPTFVADVQGDYVISLIVTDIFNAVSEPDTVAVSFTNVKPVANAGASQAVIVGETVFLDGSASHDENGDPLTYSWSFVSKPADSVADFDDCNSLQPSFVADQVGTFIVSLVVNDGFVDSDPANVTIEVISCVDAGVQSLLDAIDAINALDESSLKNRKMKIPLTNKINAVLGKVENGLCGEAANKLQNDLLKKTNGCAEIGEPDRNDWLITCEAQEQVYSLIMSAIAFLDKPDCTCF